MAMAVAVAVAVAVLGTAGTRGPDHVTFFLAPHDTHLTHLT